MALRTVVCRKNIESVSCLTTDALQSESLALEGIHNIHGSLPLGMLHPEHPIEVIPFFF